MRIIKSQVNDEKSDVVALTHAEAGVQPSIVSGATSGAICNGKSDKKIEDTIRLVDEITTVDCVPSTTNPTTSFTP